jgi:vancomycin resistance protein VanJ
VKRAKQRKGGLLRGLVRVTAILYLLCVLLFTGALAFVGETWWVTAALAFLPRLPLLLPAPILALALWWAGFRRLLWTQALAAAVVLVPLMGLVLPWPVSRTAQAPMLRVLSFNVNSAYGGDQAIADQIATESPDVVLLQETPPGGGKLSEALRARYPHVESSTQFIVASRFPISERTDPERLPFFGRQRSPRFMRYVIATSLGPITFFNVHPISPRGVLHVHTFRAALHQLRTGEIFSGDPEADVASNVGLRALQLESVAQLAAREQGPVIIAGDTNSPALSRVLRSQFGAYSDGFRAASSGFGYTFPSGHPFMRIDRIFAGPELRFVSFDVACRGPSDHACVVAELQRKP